MLFLLIPILVIFVIALLCLNFKIGFIVADRTAKTGFDMGYYAVTVFGLLAVETSLAIYIFSLLKG